ncbi:MAG TPA: hypothetical protein VK193_08745 [Methyloceanibacter sp.]|jgi:hypothetical protein|nr:hypothetical protein [Methyloceanibacter sp.]
MTARRCIAWFGALLAVGFIGTGVSIGSHPARAAMFGMTLAEDDVPGDKSLIEQSGEAATPSDDQAQTGSHAPKYPIKFKTVDYQESGDTGKLTLAGTAPPESPVYIYFDEEPLVKVLADKDGNWSAEKEVKLDDQRHMLRAEQYDATTRMVSGRATVMLARAPADAGTPAPDNPAPPATSP